MNYPNWQGQEIIEFYLENHFENKIDYGDVYNNSEVLGLAKLLYDNNYDLPKEFKGIVEKVISLELQDNNLKEWDKPKKRKKVLLNFLKTIDKLITSGLGYDYDSNHLDITAQRMMLLVFYVGWSLELPKKQTLGMVSIAKNKVILS